MGVLLIGSIFWGLIKFEKFRLSVYSELECKPSPDSPETPLFVTGTSSSKLDLSVTTLS
jgi:hypothetical protein